VISPAEKPLKLEKYDVLEEIGHGGMATVYRARDKRLGRDVAVKVIHKHLRENKEVAARFVSEARAVAKLKHPSIVEVYDVSDEADEERYLIVELVPGTTLRKLLAERGHVPAEVSAAIGLEIAGALDHAHQQGVVHRDVKPENVLVDTTERAPSGRALRSSQERPTDAEAGRVKITDFGIAKLLDAQGVTSTGQVLGSPAHMAPEQIEGGEVSARADVFGMGVLLYECMVGRLPFEGKNPAQVLRKVLDGTFTPPERARPSVGAGFSRIVERALEREAKDRYASCGELCDALREELGTLGFEDPRRELAEYLTAGDKYLAEYEPRIVKRLVELGKKARALRHAPLAAAYFNRALAFRPDDAELLRQVAGLAQSERMRRLAVRGAAAVGIALVCGGAAYGVSRATRPKLQIQSELPPVERTANVAPLITPDPSTPPGPSASASSEPTGERNKAPVIHTGAWPVADAATGTTRKVSVVIQGAKSGTVKIDGAVVSNIFTPVELTTGNHTFEFIPPDADCCVNLGPTVRKIEPGEGVQSIVGKIPFKDATVSFSSSEDGATASCGTLFSGTLKPGQAGKVHFGDGPSQSGICVVNGPEGSGAAPKSLTLDLRPGKSYSLSWP
jgi:eukaryotic-like serine/threonine-protein kinase